MRRLLFAVLGAALTAATLTGITSTPTQAAAAQDQNCSDFSSQSAAQQYFLNNGGPNDDPDGLDYDGDGIACETNPCPCMYSTGGGGGGEPADKPKNKHNLWAKGYEKGDTDKFFVKGQTKTYKGNKVVVQRKLKGKSFRLFKRTLANKKTGKFKTQINGPTGSCFKVIVPATKRYRMAVKKIGCIV